MKDDLVSSIQDWFISQGLTLSLAESCTGGSLAARITRLAGCSQYFMGSVVCYSNEMKTRVLGVGEDVLVINGAVSGPVVGAMAQGILALTRSDYSVAVSGIAGPGGGSLEKPLGTVWGAIAGHFHHLVQAPIERESPDVAVRDEAIRLAIAEEQNVADGHSQLVGVRRNDENSLMASVPQNLLIWNFQVMGNREEIIEQAVNILLTRLKYQIEGIS